MGKHFNKIKVFVIVVILIQENIYYITYNYGAKSMLLLLKLA